MGFDPTRDTITTNYTGDAVDITVVNETAREGAFIDVKVSCQTILEMRQERLVMYLNQADYFLREICYMFFIAVPKLLLIYTLNLVKLQN